MLLTAYDHDIGCVEVLNQNLFHWWAVARWCHVAAPRHHVDQLGQHDDNVAFVYLLRLHPLLGHLLRAKLNESKPSWGTYPTMVAELISGNVGCMRATENLTNFKFPDHPSRRVYFNLTSNTAGSASSPAEVFSGKLLFLVLPVLVPCTLQERKRCHDS